MTPNVCRQYRLPLVFVVNINHHNLWNTDRQMPPEIPAPVTDRNHQEIDLLKNLLVIEDDADDFHALSKLFKALPDYKLTHSGSLKDGLEKLESTFDLVLLDLTLPDNDGLDAISSISNKTSTPIVVLTGLADEKTAVAALNLGAQDYLVKGKSGSEIMAKTLLYAIERNRLQTELDETRELVLRAREQQRLTSTSAHTISEQQRLHETDPEVFQQFCHSYQAILEDSLEQRSFKVDHDVSGQLRELALECGNRNMLPRDLVELHTEALNEKTRRAPAKKNSVYSEEGMYMLVGLMGYLCTFYKGKIEAPP